MKITFGGVRGTATTADTAHAGFGGETTCFLMQGAGGETIVVDAGTGLRVVEPVVESACKDRRALLLMTHYHLDHVVGLPRFSLLHSPSWSLEIAAPPLSGRTAQEVIPRIFEKPFWPVQMSGLRAAVRFTALAESCSLPRSWGGLNIRWCAVHHPDGCTAYRIDEPASGRSVVIATDLEWDASTGEEKQDFERFCREPTPTDLLIWDGHFTPENYERFRGWGHSRWSDGVEVAGRVGARRLLITHHAPNCEDTALKAVEKALVSAMPEARMARQGMIVEVAAA